MTDDGIGRSNTEMAAYRHVPWRIAHRPGATTARGRPATPYRRDSCQPATT